MVTPTAQSSKLIASTPKWLTTLARTTVILPMAVDMVVTAATVAMATAVTAPVAMATVVTVTVASATADGIRRGASASAGGAAAAAGDGQATSAVHGTVDSVVLHGAVASAPRCAAAMALHGAVDSVVVPHGAAAVHEAARQGTGRYIPVDPDPQRHPNPEGSLPQRAFCY